MSAGTRQRLVDAPDQDYLTRQEVARYLRMETKTLTRLIEAGVFPRAFQLSPGTFVWSWREVTAYAMLQEVKGRFRVKRKLPAPHEETIAPLPRTSGKRPPVPD